MSLAGQPNVLGGPPPTGFISNTSVVGKTNAGSTGPQTINAAAGSVLFAIAAASLQVTNSLVTANSIIICQVANNDATMTGVQITQTTGSFTIFPQTAAPTAQTRVNWVVLN